ncbi:hypothetical protein EV378_0809 [Pseudonocardia endophytica]|uniref:Uncharacterized protein n=1 Tax=Pseudonocardia endophytica TaxID=401976 RepID=A0A4R1I4Q7_PSEEN|nr:hypothetical protein EV378_0809 [Pseudonocardia endophytica]
MEFTSPIPVQRPGGGARPEKPKKSRSAAVIAVLSLLTALLTLATGYLGYQTATITRDKEAAAAQSSGQVGSLQQQITALKQENDGLRSQLGMPPTSATSGGAAVAGTERHTGQVTFVLGPGIDADAPASDPKWGIDSGGSGADLFLSSSGSIDVSSGSESVYLAQQRPDYATCSQNTTYRSKDIDRGLALPGASFCLRTGEDRYAGVTILANGNEQATLQITTWEKDPTN